LLLLLLLARLAGLLLGGELVAIVGGEWLTIGTVQLRVGWWVLATPHRMRRDESLSLGADRSEDALLREAHTVGAAAVFGLFEARATNLTRD
jgi:hypothetical protein